MYRVHHRIKRHYLLYLIVLVGASILVGIAWEVVSGLRPNTILHQSLPVTHHVAASAQPLQHITKDILALDIPAGWVATAAPSVPYKIYSWRGGTGTNDAARRLDIYLDNIPSTLAVNRLLPVQSGGDHFLIAGLTSDNCSNFTDKLPDTVKTGRASSKWAGVSFWCDMGNYERDVVATGSMEGINTTTLTGATAGSHHVLLLYTDNSASPDYSLFGSVVKSLLII